MNSNIFTESTEKHFTDKIKIVKTIEQLKEYRKEYYQRNQDKWKQQYAKMNCNLYIDCALCKSSVKKRHIQEHIKTKKHTKLYNEHQILMTDTLPIKTETFP